MPKNIAFTIGLFLFISLFLTNCSTEDSLNTFEEDTVFVEDESTTSCVHNNDSLAAYKKTICNHGMHKYQTLIRHNYPKDLRGKRIYISGSNKLTRKQSNALQFAISRFNSKIPFTFSTSPRGIRDYVITIKTPNSPSGFTCGGSASTNSSGLYSNGLAKSISIWRGNIGNASDKYLRSLFMHELGHCIGFRHPVITCNLNYNPLTSSSLPVMRGVSGCSNFVSDSWNSSESYVLRNYY